MEVALFPKNASEETLAALALSGIEAIAVDALETLTQAMATDWSVLVIELGDEPMRRLRHLDAIIADSGIPTLVIAETSQLELVATTSSISDFIVVPAQAAEIALRIKRLHSSGGTEDVLRFKDLELNTLTYQAHLGNTPLDLTFMEYELLRFLIEGHGRVWSREQLLSKVWGYDYYGGARTVDVHVRRLRSKLGDDRSAWITTVRSVGYRWG